MCKFSCSSVLVQCGSVLKICVTLYERCESYIFCLQWAEKVVGPYSFWFSVFLSIQRRHFEQVKVAVPVIVSVLKVISSEPEDGDTEIDGLFDRAVGIANSIHEVCTKLVCDTPIQDYSLYFLYPLMRLWWPSILWNRRAL